MRMVPRQNIHPTACAVVVGADVPTALSRTLYLSHADSTSADRLTYRPSQAPSRPRSHHNYLLVPCVEETRGGSYLLANQTKTARKLTKVADDAPDSRGRRRRRSGSVAAQSTENLQAESCEPLRAPSVYMKGVAPATGAERTL